MADLSWSARFLILLLIGDAFLILLHFLLFLSPFEVNNRFYLDFDGGLGEWFQYLKYAGMIGLLAATLRRQRQPLYLFWLVLFVYLLLDDALRLHEVGGRMLVNVANLPPVLTLRPQDLGELGISGFTAVFFLTMLVLTYRHSDFQARRFCQWMLLLFVGLAFFGVGADMLPSLTFRILRPYPLLLEMLTIIEDGGEMIMVSLMVWITYREAERVCGWTSQQVEA